MDADLKLPAPSCSENVLVPAQSLASGSRMSGWVEKCCLYILFQGLPGKTEESRNRGCLVPACFSSRSSESLLGNRQRTYQGVLTTDVTGGPGASPCECVTETMPGSQTPLELYTLPAHPVPWLKCPAVEASEVLDSGQGAGALNRLYSMSSGCLWFTNHHVSQKPWSELM